MITPGHCASSLIPAVDVAHFDIENGALKSIHARIPANLVVVVAAAHAVLAQHPYALGQFIGVRRHHAGVAGGAHVLGGIKAECGNVAQPAGLRTFPLRAPGLRRIFNQLQTPLSADPPKCRPVGALAVEVYRQNRAHGLSHPGRPEPAQRPWGTG